MIPHSDTFMQMLQNKEKVITSILADMDSSQKNMEAFEKLEALLEQGKPVDADKAMRACAKSLRHVNDVNRKLLILLLVYVSGDSYSSDAATVLMKMGRGEDALREMFRQKMAS